MGIETSKEIRNGSREYKSACKGAALFNATGLFVFCKYGRITGNEKNAFILGRLAVLKEYRGKNIGAQMLQKVEKVVAQKGGTSISLHAQCRVQKFYEKCGYTVFGEVGEEEKCPHIWMSKQI